MTIQYDIDTLTVHDVQNMLANGNNTHHNQIRVTKDGKVYLSQDIICDEQLENIALRYPTFPAYQDYVGSSFQTPDKDTKLFIHDIFQSLKENWQLYQNMHICIFVENF